MQKPPFTRWWKWFADQRAVLHAGIALILAGILFLSLSGAVTATGTWWQATLDAFGVALIVGGVVDVLVIWWLNQRDKAEEKQKQQAFDGLAKFLLEQPDPDAKPMAWDLLISASPYMDAELRQRLFRLVREGSEPPLIPDLDDRPRIPGNR